MVIQIATYCIIHVYIYICIVVDFLMCQLIRACSIIDYKHDNYIYNHNAQIISWHINHIMLHVLIGNTSKYICVQIFIILVMFLKQKYTLCI